MCATVSIKNACKKIIADEYCIFVFYINKLINKLKICITMG